MTMTISSLVPALRKLPDDAPEAVIVKLFANPLLEVLGFEFNEVVPAFQTGGGVVDIAARKNKEDDIFIASNVNPYLLVEVKARNFNLVPSGAGYQNTVNQLKKYLLAPKCQSVQWGIITNSSHIQIFRKHGKTIFPASKCLAINETNIDEVIASIKSKIAEPLKALSVAIYNNQGGVGKTTTTVNLAGILSFLGKKVLVVDFDHNQQDLTTILGIHPSQGTVFKALTDKEIALNSVICNYTYLLPKSGKKVGFDIIPADTSMTESMGESNLLAYFQPNTLHRKLEALRHVYDYILIDAPPNWKLFSKLPIYAADVVLIPTKHNSFSSLKNAAVAITKFISEVQEKKTDGNPIALPIFFNGEEMTDYQLGVTQQTIDSIIDTYRKEKKGDLLPYFYPRYSQVTKDKQISKLPKYAHIANAAFSHVPAVYQYRIAYDYYKDLVKEYFLQ